MKPITFCINTARNELNHIKLLFLSLESNLSSREHEILVFIDSDNQGTFEWLLTQKAMFPNLKILRNNLPIPYGYQRNINELFCQATNEIVSYLQSDMVVCKDYDVEVLKHLEPNTIICSTRIEPSLHGNSGEKITHDLGVDPTKFDLRHFTQLAESYKQNKKTEYFFAPFTLYKALWNKIGGHDTMFRRSREDSDILIRLTLNDVKIVQTWSALVYHFTCTSSRGVNWFDKENTEAQQRTQLQQVADAIEMGRFISKWGSFNHDLQKVRYYNIAGHITGNSLDLSRFAYIHHHFHKLYVEDQKIVDSLQTLYDKWQQPANQLLNVSESDWSVYGYMFNRIVAKEKVQLVNGLIDEDVIIKFDINDVTVTLYEEFIQRVQSIIDSVEEEGQYEYGPFTIIVNKKIDRASEKIVVLNPQIKPEHKYSIH